jgi:hypothetical protein
MEPSEKEELLKQVRSIIHEEVGPVIAAFMEYADDRFDDMDERFVAFLEALEGLCDAISSRSDAS